METGLKGGLFHKSVALQDIFAVHVLGVAQRVLSKITNPEPFLAKLKQASDQTDKSNRYFNSGELRSKLNIWSIFVVKRFSQNHFLFLTNQIKCIPYFRPSQSENL